MIEKEGGKERETEKRKRERWEEGEMVSGIENLE